MALFEFLVHAIQGRWNFGGNRLSIDTLRAFFIDVGRREPGVGLSS